MYSHEPSSRDFAFIEQEFRRYLDCGILAKGFARLRCPSCGFERLVAFSCKGPQGGGYGGTPGRPRPARGSLPAVGADLSLEGEISPGDGPKVPLRDAPSLPAHPVRMAAPAGSSGRHPGRPTRGRLLNSSSGWRLPRLNVASPCVRRWTASRCMPHARSRPTTGRAWSASAAMACDHHSPSSVSQWTLRDVFNIWLS